MDILNILIISVVLGLIWWYFKSPTSASSEIDVDNVTVENIEHSFPEDYNPEDYEEPLEFNAEEYELQQELIRRTKAADRIEYLKRKLAIEQEFNELKRRHEQLKQEYTELQEYSKISDLM